MKVKSILFILIIFGNLKVFSKGSGLLFNPGDPLITDKLIIDNNDSIIFDLANATLTASYLDLPLYIKSDDVVFGIDYAMKFTLAKLTFSAAIDLIPSNSSAHFNSNDLFLRYTGGSMQSLPCSAGVYVTKIRFALSAPCVSITTADFTNISALLNGNSCSYRVTNLNFGKFIPNASFKTSPTCLNTTILFSDTSTLGSGTISSWLWNFGNGSTSTLQNNLTSYSTTGTVAATLIVTASSGCTNTIIKPLIISHPPVSSFSYSFNCLKDSVFFTNTSTISSGTITGSLWYFGDLSSTSTLKNPSHHYNTSGFYKVKLTSTSNFSCTATKTVLISLRPADLNKDGTTDVNDFLILAPAYNTSCN